MGDLKRDPGTVWGVICECRIERFWGLWGTHHLHILLRVLRANQLCGLVQARLNGAWTRGLMRLSLSIAGGGMR